MDEERYWQAVLAREKTFDGAFVYAVRSTGIFCRPTCPSRRPRREQVVFFGQPAAAEQAGFRACQRCRPAAANSAREPIGAGDARTDMVRRACQIIEEADEAPTLSELGERMGVSSY